VLPSLDSPDPLRRGRARDAGLTDTQLHSNLALIVDTRRHFGVEATPGEITPAPRSPLRRSIPRRACAFARSAAWGAISPASSAPDASHPRANPRQGQRGHRDSQLEQGRRLPARVARKQGWNNTNAKIPIALGKDVYGRPSWPISPAMPHMLIGAPPVPENRLHHCILMSFLFRFTPMNCG